MLAPLEALGCAAGLTQERTLGEFERPAGIPGSHNVGDACPRLQPSEVKPVLGQASGDFTGDLLVGCKVRSHRDFIREKRAITAPRTPTSSSHSNSSYRSRAPPGWAGLP
jgi:hypothetical protein